MTEAVKFGLTLPNRMVVVGRETLDEIIETGVEAEESGHFHSLWVGDSLIAKRRPESVVLLSALAARTRRVRLGVGCMASFAIRHPLWLAVQWATLDLLAGPGRLILAACRGGRLAHGDWEMEQEAYGIPDKERLRRMVEGLAALRALWTQERATFEGEFYRFQGVVSEPRPVTQPHPALWISSNPRSLTNNREEIYRGLLRVAQCADGWQTTMLTPQGFAERWQMLQEAVAAVGKDPAGFDNCLYYNANINEDREAAVVESTEFLTAYYPGMDVTRDVINLWVAHGSPQQVAERLRAYIDAGAKEITIRMTSPDQKGQIRRLVEEVLPLLRTKGHGA